MFGKARCLPAPANLENLVQQHMRQARPSVCAELLFVRKVCELDVAHFRRIHQDTESAFKDVMTKFVESQQRGESAWRPRARSRSRSRDRRLLMESLSCMRRLDSVMKKDLTPEQFAHYRAEVEKRQAFHKQAGVRYLVDAIDRDLYLSDEQRLKLAESLSSHWDPGWNTSLEYLLVRQPVLSGRVRSLCDTATWMHHKEDMGRCPESGRPGGSVRSPGLVHE